MFVLIRQVWLYNFYWYAMRGSREISTKPELRGTNERYMGRFFWGLFLHELMMQISSGIDGRFICQVSATGSAACRTYDAPKSKNHDFFMIFPRFSPGWCLWQLVSPWSFCFSGR
jgi:hypothetical protein